MLDAARFPSLRFGLQVPPKLAAKAFFHVFPLPKTMPEAFFNDSRFRKMVEGAILNEFAFRKLPAKRSFIIFCSEKWRTGGT
jgi:hypothetical protein